MIGVLAVLIAAPSYAADDAATATMLKDAASGAKDKRYTAIDDLGERHANASQVVPQLLKLLTDSDPQVRWRTARTLGEYGEQAKEAAPGLRKLLGDSDPIVQYHAATALGKVEDTSDATVDALIGVATSQDPRVARASIAALRNLKPGPKRVAEALAKALKSNDHVTSMHALEAIVEQGPKALPLVKEALKQPETAYLACAAVEQMGPDAAPVVPDIAALLGTTKHSHVLIRALLALAAIGPGAESASPQVKSLLASHMDATVPVAAAFALGSIGAKDADAELEAAAAKNDPFLQMIATWALAKLHPNDQAAQKAAIDKLIRGLESDNETLRNAAAKSLQLLQAPPEMVAPGLVSLLNDSNPAKQVNVIEAIASLGESVVPKVTNALKNPQLRSPAIQVLTKLGPKAAGAVKPLAEAAKGADPKTRTDIQFALAAIGPAAAPATVMLVESLADKDAGVRESALLALRQIGPGAKAAVQRLTRRMQADDSFEAIASALALSQIALGDGKVAPLVAAKLAKGLSHTDEQTRLECVKAIAEMGPAASSAAPALERAAREDSSDLVRGAAEAALKK
jgi:HEAT repeat protein